MRPLSQATAGTDLHLLDLHVEGPQEVHHGLEDAPDLVRIAAMHRLDKLELVLQ